MRKLTSELEALGRQATGYPFVAALDPLRILLDSMRDQPATWFITGPLGQEDQLLDAKENILDKVRSFMSGPQRASMTRCAHS